MRIFKNKFFIISLTVALAIAISATVLGLMGIEAPLRNIFGTITAPFRFCAAKISEGIGGFSVYFEKVEKLAEENAELKAENARLREALADAEAAAYQDEFLREYLLLSPFKTDWKRTDATVIGREAGSYRTVWTLNRGSAHGIKKGMPVMTAAGVIGSVNEVGLSWCTVTSILETTSAVGVYDKRTGASGLLVGDMKLRTEGLCRLEGIDAEADIRVGDLIVTAGTGSIYPEGLVVGVVTELIPDEFSRTLTATVKPSVDFSSISTVMILTSCEIKPYTADDILPDVETEEAEP